VNEPRRLKRVVIKEELVELTGDFVKAVLLQQMLYWSERVRDFKQFAREELQRAEKWGPPETLDGKKEFVDDMVYGWVYKTAEELSSETMLNLAANTIRRHLKELVEKGYLLERSNPKYRWDRTLQYRVDLLKVQTDLMALGYPLEGYSVELPIAKMEHGASACGDSASHVTPMEVPSSKMENQSSEMENQICETGATIPEITTENTTERNHCASQAPHTGEAEEHGHVAVGMGLGLPVSKKERGKTLPIDRPSKFTRSGQKKNLDEIAEAVQRMTSDENRRKESKKKPVRSSKTIIALFQEESKRVFGGCVPFETGKDMKLLKTMIDEMGYETVVEMMNWLFRNWAVFQRECKLRPGLPTIGLFWGYRSYLYSKVLDKGAVSREGGKAEDEF
jgi:hypothetical protein